MYLEHRAVLSLFLQEISGGPQIDGRIRNDLLPDGVDGRVRHLRKKLLEIAEQRLPRFREHRQRDIRPHRGDGFRPVSRQREDRLLDILIGVAECLVQLVPQQLRMLFHLLVRDGQILQMDQMPVQPFSVRAL